MGEKVVRGVGELSVTLGLMLAQVSELWPLTRGPGAEATLEEGSDFNVPV